MKSRLIAAAALVLLVIGQLFALGHVANARHATCAEHGEQVEAPTLAGADDQCEQSHLIGVESGSDHEDCAIAQFLHAAIDGASRAPAVAVAALSAISIDAVLVEAPVVLDVVAYAPKTSPPPHA